MNDTTTSVVAPEYPMPITAPATKKALSDAAVKAKAKTVAKVKPAAKKATPAAKPVANGSAFLGKTAPQRKVELVKALRKWEATSAGSARSARAIADKFGCERKDIRIIVCGGSLGKVDDSPTCLIATGHVKASTDDGNGRMGFYLTAKGKTTKFDDAPFA